MKQVEGREKRNQADYETKPENRSIKNLATADRPREKLKLKGASALTDGELLAILIQNGTKEKSAMDLAQELVARSKNRLNDLARLSTRELMKTKGIGLAKAVIIQAALELGRRRMASEHLQTETINTCSSTCQG
jgi:DNA repair protein RadC